MFHKILIKFKIQLGLSLIEIMVSFTIICTAFIVLIQFFPLSLSINKTAENITKASFLAQEKIEELYPSGYENIPVGTIESKHRLSDDQNNYLYYFQRQTVVNYVDNNLQDCLTDNGLKEISVTVFLINSILKIEKEFNVTTLISKH